MASWKSTPTGTCIILSVIILLSGLQLARSAPAKEKEVEMKMSDEKVLGQRVENFGEQRLSCFLPKYKEIFKSIMKLYKSSKNPKFKNRCWPPKNILKPLKKAPSYASAAGVFYRTLMKYSDYIKILMDIPIETQANFNVSERKTKLKEVRDNLLAIADEFNYTLSIIQGTKDQMNPKIIKLSKNNTMCLPKKMDRSKSYSIDIGAMNTLKRFLFKGRNILRNLRQKEKIEMRQKEKSNKNIIGDKKVHNNGKKNRNLKESVPLHSRANS